MADIDIKIVDNSGEILKIFENQLTVALEAVATQAESHAKQVITDFVVYGKVKLPAGYKEADNSRVDTGRMRNSVAHTVVKHDAYIGTNLKYAVYHELGTGRYASQSGGRYSEWVYFDRHGKAHKTKGLYPIHFLKKAASEHTAEYKAIIEKIMTGK